MESKWRNFSRNWHTIFYRKREIYVTYGTKEKDIPSTVIDCSIIYKIEKSDRL